MVELHTHKGVRGAKLPSLSFTSFHSSSCSYLSDIGATTTSRLRARGFNYILFSHRLAKSINLSCMQKDQHFFAMDMTATTTSAAMAMATNTMDSAMSSATAAASGMSMAGMGMGGSGECKISVSIHPPPGSIHDSLCLCFLLLQVAYPCSYDHRCSGIGTPSTHASSPRHGTSPPKACSPGPALASSPSCSSLSSSAVYSENTIVSCCSRDL